MTSEVSIFDGVVINENAFTELFRNFLKYKPFREAFLDIIEVPFELKNIEYEAFDTQYTIQKFGRPDLAIVNEEIEILFEIKVFGTGFTENQPNGYYNYLKSFCKKNNKALILIIPESKYYIDTYTELLKNIECIDEQKITHQIIHWETITKIITDNELGEISTLFNHYSIFLKDLFQMNEIFLNTINAKIMFDKSFPESLLKTTQIIDKLLHEFKNKGFSVRRAKGTYWAEYGFYIDTPFEEDLFIGIWFDYWLETGNPVCISFDGDTDFQIENFKQIVEEVNLEKVVEFENCLLTTVKEKTLKDDKALQSISELLIKICDKMGAKLIENNV